MFDWIMPTIRVIFAAIDSAVVWFIKYVYQLFISIADVNLFQSDILDALEERVYAILGIFMLFKTAISFIHFVLNPDEFMDKSKGAKKIFLSIFLVLIAIVSVRPIIDLAMNFQVEMIKNNTVGKFILGSANSDDAFIQEDAGQVMAYYLISAFIQPNPDILPSCVGYQSMATLSSACIEEANAKSAATEGGGTAGRILSLAVANKDASFLLNKYLLLTRDVQNDFLFDYILIIPTICGALLIWVILLFCIDIAIRSVKMAFLVLIAPIPIISILDPSPKGMDKFKKWVGKFVMTYADLFLRQALLAFAIFVVGLVVSNFTLTSFSTGGTFSTGSAVLDSLVKVAIILGALIFAYRIPKELEEFGIKMGNFTLNPVKKIGESPIAAAAIGGAAGLVTGGIGNAAAAVYNGADKIKKLKESDEYQNNMTKGQQRLAVLKAGIGNTFSGVRSTIGGAGGGFAHSTAASYRNKNFVSGVSQGLDINVKNRERHEKNAKYGYGLFDRMNDIWKGKFGIDTSVKMKGLEAADNVQQFTQMRQVATEELYKDLTAFTNPNTGAPLTQKERSTYLSIATQKKDSANVIHFYDSIGRELGTDRTLDMNLATKALEVSSLGKLVVDEQKKQAFYQQEKAKKEKK